MFSIILKISYFLYTVLSMYYVVLYNKMAEDIEEIKKTLNSKKK
jgi:hypothetical protein